MKYDNGSLFAVPDHIAGALLGTDTFIKITTEYGPHDGVHMIALSGKEFPLKAGHLAIGGSE